MLLTKRQKQILTYLSASIGKNGYAPSMAEIGRHFGLQSISTVHKHLVHLEQKGCIKRNPHRARAIEVLPERRVGAARELPLVGTIAAGEPIEAIATAELLSVPEDMIGRGDHYVLRVRGESMTDEHIRDGDYVIVENRYEAVNGETVVALIRDETATLKKYFREREKIRLQPAHPTMEALWLDESDVKIQGVVTGVLRKY